MRAELAIRALSALRRPTAWWGVGIVTFVVVNAAFWPSLEGSDALQNFEDIGALMEAFGAESLASPAGYLDGQVFALMLPLLLSAMTVAGTTALTAGDEDAGRLELLHALPVTRTHVWLSRWAAAVVAVAAVSAGTAVAVVVSLAVFSFDGVGAWRAAGAVAGCGALAAFHGAIGYAAAGLGLPRGRAAGVAALVAIAGYVVSFVLPLAASLQDVDRWSPWHWAIGRQPVSDGVRGAGLATVAASTALLVALGTWAVNRRDIRSP